MPAVVLENDISEEYFNDVVLAGKNRLYNSIC